MGKANRERRKLKEKARRQGRSRAESSAPSSGSRRGPAGGAFFTFPPEAPPPPPTAQERAEALLDEAVYAVDRGDLPTVARCVQGLAAPDAAWRRTVGRVLDDVLRSLVTRLWTEGWQPADVMRVVARDLKTPHQRLARAAIAQEMSGYAAATVDARWSAQLAEADAATPWWPQDINALVAWAREGDGAWPEAVEKVLELMHLLAQLPRLEVMMPVPGTAAPARPGLDAAVDERVLSRVRALLAKAESTTFAAEAETFTAGAQALMARHSIDHAMLTATGRAPADAPEGRRLGIDAPYEAPKTALLDAVATANRCRAVWSKHLGFATVVGHPGDLDTVELLFTSLLVQATTAMTQEGRRSYTGGGSRTRSFRQSFLLSFAARIRERLTETTRQETDAAAARPGYDHLLPVLRSRDEAVEKATAAMFPELTSQALGHAWDREGWASGRAAADLASLAPGDAVQG